jgi:hypothetical protein
MAKWFVDLVLNLDWFCARGGTIPLPVSKSKLVDERGQPVEFLLYGEGEAIDHLRVLVEAQDYEEASRIVDSNVAFWREAIAVTSAMSSSTYSSAATLGSNSSAHPVLMGEGDADTPLLALSLQWAGPVPADYEAAATIMAMWPRDIRHHLHFLAKFLNPSLPADVRWLQGYRFLEWHFERGAAKLGRNQKFREFLDQYGGSLDEFKLAGQSRVGFLEEIRAALAHALLADRPMRGAGEQIQNAATNTFVALEGLVTQVLNDLGLPGIEFKRKPPLEATSQGD